MMLICARLTASHYYQYTAMKFLPLWNEAYTMFNISIHHHRRYTAISNMDTKKTTQFDKYTDDNIWTVFESEKLYTHDVAVILIEHFSIIIPRAVTAQSTLCESGSEFWIY